MKRKVNIDRKPLASEEINATKDFGSLMSKAGGASVNSPKPNGSKIGWFAGGIAAIAIATGIYFGTQSESTSLQPEETIAITEQPDSVMEKPFVNPPIPEADIPNESYYVDADNGGKIKHHTGTEITIPQGAFMDEEGNIVEGEVEIQYREFHDQADIFLSGIPMKYDSAGKEQIFESAGMMEIRGFKDGKRLKIVPEKNFVICMHTKNPDPKFNLYFLDEEDKKWDYEGKDSVSVQEELPELAAAPKFVEIKNAEEKKIDQDQIKGVEEKIEVIKKEVKEIEKKIPNNKPRKADPTKKNFKIDVVDGEYPELSVYSGVIFEVTDKNTLPEDTYRVTWNDIKLEENEGDFSIKLIKDKRTEEIDVTPVLEGEDYEKAKKEFNEKFGEYEKKLKTKMAEKKIEEKKLEQLKAKYSEQQEAYERRVAEMKRNMNNQQRSSFEMQRVFSISKFGTWNCDSPVPVPKGMIVKTKFVNERTGESLAFTKLDLIETNRNACFPLYGGIVNELKFNPRRKNVLWGVTESGMIAVATTEDFDEIERGQKRHVFNMSLIDITGKSSAEIKQLLKT